jgi:hypothetical protein
VPQGHAGVPPMDVPAAARLWNELAGGVWADTAEQDLAAALEDGWPGTKAAMRAARLAHARAASWAVGPAGGCRAVIFGAAGLPAPGPPHPEAAEIDPRARFFYCDPDPEAVLYSLEAYASARVRAVRGSVLDPPMAPPRGGGPPGLLASCGTGNMHVMMQVQMVVQFWPSDAAAQVVKAWAAALPPGSVLFLSLFCISPAGRGRAFAEFLAGAVGGQAFSHSPEDVRGWLEGAGLEMISGPADVRAWPDRGWAEEGLASSPVRAVTAAARVR